MKHRVKTIDGRTLRTGNDKEREAIEKLSAEGWKVYKRGWPDLIAERNGVLRLVEVKPRQDIELSKHQEIIARFLLTVGLVVEIYPPPIRPEG